jgi:hypothetical protein
MTNPIYISLVEQLFPTLPSSVPDGVLVGAMLMTLRRQWGDLPREVFDCWDRELTAALRILRQRDSLNSGWKN